MNLKAGHQPEQAQAVSPLCRNAFEVNEASCLEQMKTPMSWGGNQTEKEINKGEIF